MASLDQARFGISYSGSTKFENVGDISFVNIKLENAGLEISAELVESAAQDTTQYPQFRTRSTTGDAWRDKFSERIFDAICVMPAIAKTMKLSAWISQSSETFIGRNEMPIFLDPLPVFGNRKCYWIQIVHKENQLTGEIVEISQQNLDSKIRSARLYPGSPSYSPAKETQLNSDQEEVYSVFNSMVHAIGGWICQFVKEAAPSSLKNISLYENVAREALRQQIKQIKSEASENLLKLKREGERGENLSRLLSLLEEYQKAKTVAIGPEQYATIMRRTLEAVAGESASRHEEKIARISAEFADRYKS